MPLNHEEIEAFLTIDDNLLTHAPAEINDIVTLLGPRTEKDSSDDEADDAPEPQISCDVAMSCLETLQTFFIYQGMANDADWTELCNLQSKVQKAYYKTLKQKTITEFFNRTLCYVVYMLLCIQNKNKITKMS